MQAECQGREAMGDDAGQAAFLLVLMLSTFLLAVLGFAVDLTNVWFHRQAATAASDAACQAGALDMLASAGGLSLPAMGFTPGQDSDCASSSAATMCTYARLNGYGGLGLVSSQPSNSVAWTFPSTVQGVTPGGGTYSFLQVTVTENVPTYFISLVNASHVQPITVKTTCGLTQVKGAAPMVVLNPTKSGAFYYSGGGELDIVGGPSRGLQVNSSSSTAVQWLASAKIDLSGGGPQQTGSDVAIVGGPAAIPNNGSSSGFNGGSTGKWKSNVLPIPDPFGAVGAPLSVRNLSPLYGTSGRWVQGVSKIGASDGVNGCPEIRGLTGQPGQDCKEFSPGYYPSGIDVSSVMNNYTTAIFDPGIYYLDGALTIGGNATMRMARPPGYGQTDGVMFYFLSGSLNISGCSGCSSSNVENVAASSLTCDGSLPPAALGMPATLYGNVLWGQCSANGTYWDAGNDTTDSRGSPGSRGLLVYQDHGNTASPAWTGSGALTFSGALYFHSTNYADVLSLSGGSSSGTFILGEIIADQVSLTGSGRINLALNPAASMNVAKVGIFQ